MSDHNKHQGEGEPFFPGHLLKESVVMLVVILFMMFLALTIPLPVESIADPTDTTYQPKPEWYFMFLFQFLKYFPGSMEVFAAVIIPALGVGALILLPFLDKNPARHPKQRPLATSGAIITVIGLIVLTILGLDDGAKPTTGQSFTFFEKWRYGLVVAIIAINFLFTMLIVNKNSPIKDAASKFITASVVAIMSGLALVTVVVFSMLQQSQAVAGTDAGSATPPGKAIIQAKCLTCHAYEGKGGSGPDLAKGSKYKTVDQLTKFLQDPTAVGSVMPKQQLQEPEIKDIAEFLASLNGGSSPATGSTTTNGGSTIVSGGSGAGKTVFDTKCMGCHKFKGEGGAAGPDLTDVAKKMDTAKLTAMIKDPAAARPGSPMPKMSLNDDDLQAVVSFLAGGGVPASGTGVAPAGAENKTATPSGAGGDTKTGPTAGSAGDPNVITLGQKTFESNSCQSCHNINGKGGAFGPDLSKVGTGRTLQWFKDYLKDPKSMIPDTQMPVVPLSGEEINAIAAYLSTLK